LIDERRFAALNNHQTINCPATSNARSTPRAPIEAVFFPSAHDEQFQQRPASKRRVWRPPVAFLLLPRTLPFFAPTAVNRSLRSFSSHSVPSMQFQVLLTCLSAFFSTFLRSTFPLSVFVSYLDLGEIYLLLYAEITINVTLKEVEIRGPRWLTREYHPLCCSFPTDFQSASTRHLTTPSKGASVWQLCFHQTLFL